MREIRWNCETQGCFRDHCCPRLGMLDECFPGKIGMSDVDGVVEIAGRFLFLEWKGPGGSVSTGQRIMFERLTALSPKLTIIVVAGNPQTMQVGSIQVFRRGNASSPEAADLEVLRARVSAWSDRASLSRSGPSERPSA